VVKSTQKSRGYNSFLIWIPFWVEKWNFLTIPQNVWVYGQEVLKKLIWLNLGIYKS
jgi:hypothetical protein